MLYDKEIPLEGPDSVIGRSIIVHGIGYDEGPKRWSARSAQCVIGRARPRTSYKFATPTEALNGVIQSGSQGGTTAPRQPQSSSGTGVLIGYMAKYPSYSGGLVVSGVVWTSETATGSISLNFEMDGLEAGVAGGIHIHTGTSCSTPGGHFWSTEKAEAMTLGQLSSTNP